MTFDSRARRAVQGVHHAVDVMERSSTKTPQTLTRFDQYRERKSRNQRIVAGAVAIIVVLVALVALTRAIRAPVPADKPPSPTPSYSSIGFGSTGQVSEGVRELVIQDSSTGEVISTLPFPVWFAAASADGRWVAFEDGRCDESPPITSLERQTGLWVTNGTEPLQLTSSCLEDAGSPAGLWAWSPAHSQIAAADGDRLILIDPATGDQTDLGKTVGDVTSLAWSPDASRIAYATVPTGSVETSRTGSVYVVSIDGGEHALIADGLGQVPGGEAGAGIAWSPDGTRIAVLADPASPRGTLFVMDADGSDRRSLAEGVFVAHTLGSPNIVWSPDGTRIAYATQPEGFDRLRIWSSALDGSAPVLAFDAANGTGRARGYGGVPVWSPDGTQIAFRYDTRQDTRDEVRRWLVTNADGSGDVHEIDELQPLSWRASWYFCECYG